MTAVDAGTALPAGSIQTSPTATYTTTANGFNLTLPDGKTVVYNTKTSAANIGAGTVITNGTTFDALITGGTSNQDVETTLTSGKASALTYATYGVWFESDTLGNPLTIGTLATGVATTTAQMVTTGTATYTGNLSGVVLSSTSAGQITGGTVSLTANFATNAISGSVSTIATQTIGTNAVGTMTGIGLTAGTITGTAFTGVATVGAQVTGATFGIVGATGTYGGKFYGPAAAEAAGSISMTGGGNTVLASFGAKKN